ncbi:unnamed protein product [Camellia sinensis]
MGRLSNSGLKLAWVVLGAAFAAALATAQTLPGCQEFCGDISIPYPFGTSTGCHIADDFLVTCNDTDHDTPKLYLKTIQSNVEITEIFLSGEFRILAWIGRDCFNKGSGGEDNFKPWIRLPKFPISNTRNKFTAVEIVHPLSCLPKLFRRYFCISWFRPSYLGRQTLAYLQYPSGSGSLGQNYTTGCMSLCDSIDNVINSSCSSTGCCQTSIPKGVTNYNIEVHSYYNQTSIWGFNPCSNAFVAEETAYNFSSSDLTSIQGKTIVPMMLDWAVGNQTCDEAMKNLTSCACKANSDCYDFDNGPSYPCNCSNEYEGNPYLPNGCIDINECIISRPCNMTCQNLRGTYNCSCPEGFESDGKKNGSGCSPIHHHRFPLINIALGSSISILVLLLGGSWLYWGFRQRKVINLREKFFQQNGGIMLQRQLSKCEESVQSAKIFTSEDLKKATNNYHESRVLGQGGHGTVYKGILPDNTIVSIKKSNVLDQSQSQIEQFINEVIILSQVNHRNVVKLLGCCFETQVPLLVYEFVTNGTLYDHIQATYHNSKKAISFNRPALGRNLAMYFVSSVKEACLFEIVDEQVMNVAKADQLKEVDILAKRCLRVKGDKRPTMKEVTIELEGLRIMEKHSWVNDNKNLEETQYLLGDQLSDIVEAIQQLTIAWQTISFHQLVVDDKVLLAAGTIKLNSDGCSKGNPGPAGYGGLFKDERGAWVHGYHGRLEEATSLEAELWGVYRGLTIILEKGMRDIVIETDSIQMVKLLHEDSSPTFQHRALLEDSKSCCRGANAPSNTSSEIETKLLMVCLI